jgi:hypothetical protein
VIVPRLDTFIMHRQHRIIAGHCIASPGLFAGRPNY